MPKRPIHQREHAVGEVVLFKKFVAADLTFEEGVQIKHSGAAVGRMDGRTWLAKGLNAHVGFRVNSVRLARTLTLARPWVHGIRGLVESEPLNIYRLALVQMKRGTLTGNLEFFHHLGLLTLDELVRASGDLLYGLEDASCCL